MQTETMHKRLFIPGPTEVLPDVRQAMATPPVGHRSAEATELGRSVIGKIQRLLRTDGPVFLSTSSSTGHAVPPPFHCGARRSTAREAVD